MEYCRVELRPAASILDPTDQPYGQREDEARDPEGHRWWFGNPITTPETGD